VIASLVWHSLFIHGDALLARMIAGRAYQETMSPGHSTGSVTQSYGSGKSHIVMVSHYSRSRPSYCRSPPYQGPD
jgi:hypothetical protein